MRLAELSTAWDDGKQLARESDTSGTRLLLVAPENLPSDLAKQLQRHTDGRCIVQWNPPGAWSVPDPRTLMADDLIEWKSERQKLAEAQLTEAEVKR